MLNSEQLRSAVDGLLSHKLRSGLTALGVIFGVAAVIGMASIGEGARREALRQIELLGASNIIIDNDRSQNSNENVEIYAKNPDGLTRLDAQALEIVIEDAPRVVPMRVIEQEISAGSKSAKLNVVATTREVFNLYNIRLEDGRKLVQSDDTEFKRICVIGWDAKRMLYPLDNPLGKEVRIGAQVYTIVGVTGRQRSSGGEISGVNVRNRNQDVYIPLSTSIRREPPLAAESELTRIVVQLEGPEKLESAARLINRIMDRRHRGVKDYKVIVPEELLRQHQETQRIFNIVMGAIASISLIVGGIGIMNIMLASVLERTKEIGVRRALGARQSDIARQFLAEAIILSMSGGLVGVLLGVILANAITLYAGWETAVSLWAIFVAVGVSVGVGVIFGWLPARRAAKLDPISALRFE